MALYQNKKLSATFLLRERLKRCELENKSKYTLWTIALIIQGAKTTYIVLVIM